MQAMHPVDEELYEISLDNHGCIGGPKAGRLSALNNVSIQLELIKDHCIQCKFVRVYD